MIERREHEADEAHVVIERQPRDADVVRPAAQTVLHDALDVRGEVRVGERDALRPRRRPARELEEGDVVEPDLLGRSGSVDSRIPSMATTCSSAGHAACTVPSRRLIFAVVTRTRAPLLRDDVPRVVEIALELAERHRRVDGHGDDARADGAEEAEDEVVVVREDERDPVALSQTERLQARRRSAR